MNPRRMLTSTGDIVLSNSTLVNRNSNMTNYNKSESYNRLNKFIRKMLNQKHVRQPSISTYFPRRDTSATSTKSDDTSNGSISSLRAKLGDAAPSLGSDTTNVYSPCVTQLHGTVCGDTSTSYVPGWGTNGPYPSVTQSPPSTLTRSFASIQKNKLAVHSLLTDTVHAGTSLPDPNDFPPPLHDESAVFVAPTAPVPKRRHWTFTSFSSCPNGSVGPGFNFKTMNYMVWQICRSPVSGRSFITGYVEFKMSLKHSSVLKQLDLPKANIQPRLNPRIVCKLYCMKSEDRVRGPYEFGDWNYKKH